jgi:hypothetical protein
MIVASSISASSADGTGGGSELAAAVRVEQAQGR